MLRGEKREAFLQVERRARAGDQVLLRGLAGSRVCICVLLSWVNKIVFRAREMSENDFLSVWCHMKAMKGELFFHFRWMMALIVYNKIYIYICTL